MPPRVISMLLIGQLLVIFFGIVVLGLRLQLEDANSLQMTAGHPAKTSFDYLRDYGFWLGLLPISWAVAAIRDARATVEKENSGCRYELAGWLILGALLLFFLAMLFGFIGWLIFFILLAVYFYFLWRRK